MSVLPTGIAAPTGGYEISRSVRLRSSASAYLNRTFGSDGSLRAWTWSGWVKRGTLSANQYLFGWTDTSSGNFQNAMSFASDNTLEFQMYNSILGGYVMRKNTAQVFRDTSAWYHLVFVWDSNNATAEDRARIYVNGVRVTAWTNNTTPSLNQNSYINYAIYPLGLGASYPSTGNYFDGYMTEVNFIDGQVLTPSSFGENDSITGVWKPKRYTSTYGTNGFYLNFSDNSNNTAATIGADSSGNGNNWTPNNISVTSGVTYDSMLDVPTMYADGGNGRGNYATLNPLISASYQTLSNANLTSKSNTSSDSGSAFSTMTTGLTGLWYCEFTANTSAGGGYPIIGTWDTSVALPSANGGSYIPGASGAATGYMSSGNKYVLGSGSAYGSSYATNAVIGIAVDCTNGAIYFSKDGTWQNSGVPTSGESKTGAANTWTGGTKEFLIGISSYTSGNGADANFGQRPFAHTPPTGFKALNTQNLPEGTIKKGNEYFNAVPYTANNSSTKNISVGFVPDLVWLKSRNVGQSHYLGDVLRGDDVFLQSDSTGADFPATNWITYGTPSDGFSLNAIYGNTSSYNYVAWNWKANGAGVSNTSGSITSSVSAGATQGFSVVTYTGNGTNGATVGHGLGVAPKMIFIKNRGAVASWLVYNASIGASNFLVLNGTDASTASSLPFNNTAPTSSVFSLGTSGGTNTNTGTFVAYCFAEVAGYSKFGSYTGNGSADGPFVYTNMRPRFILIKRTDTTGQWPVWDSERDQYNVASKEIFANSSDAEQTTEDLDFLSNGFKLRRSASNFNSSGATYIYAAFAENPFKNSLAR